MSALPNTPDPDRLLSVDEAADLLGLKPYTIRQWARDGVLPVVRMGRYWKFRRSALLEWVEERERPARLRGRR